MDPILDGYIAGCMGIVAVGVWVAVLRLTHAGTRWRDWRYKRRWLAEAVREREHPLSPRKP